MFKNAIGFNVKVFILISGLFLIATAFLFYITADFSSAHEWIGCPAEDDQFYCQCSGRFLDCTRTDAPGSCTLDPSFPDHRHSNHRLCSPGSIITIKQVDGTSGRSYDFVTSVIKHPTTENTYAFSLSDGEEFEIDEIIAGAYQIKEILPPNVVVDSITCTSDIEPPQITVNLEEAYVVVSLRRLEDVECTFHNVEAIPELDNENQYKSDSITAIPEGDMTIEDTVIFKSNVTSPDNLDTKLQVELRQINEPFTGSFDGGIIESSFIPSGQEASITRFGLADGQYHWRARALSTNGNGSPWEEFGTAGNVDFEVNTTQQPILFLHGINQSADDIRERDLFNNLLSSLDIEFGEVRAFDYVGDLALAENCPPDEVCDSQTAIADNVVELRLIIQDMFNEVGGQKITLAGYSMGSTIIRGYVALHPQEARQFVNNVFFLEGAQQGSYALNIVRSGVNDSTLLAEEITSSENPMYKRFSGMIGHEVAKLAVSTLSEGINIDRPAVRDLTPRSQWYESINPEPMPADINYYNFFGDIKLNTEFKIYIWNFKLKETQNHINLGDFILLPGRDDPTALPRFGGAKFLAQTNPQHESLQWDMREDITFKLTINLARNLGFGSPSLMPGFSGTIFGSKVWHGDFEEFTGDILVDGNTSVTDKIVNIIKAQL